MDTINRKKRERYRDDPVFRSGDLMRAMLRRFLNKVEKGKDRSTVSSLGYTPEEFSESIESKFVEGMCWDNQKDWHIDHAYPVIHLIREGVESPALVHSLDNLLPMWSSDNTIKFDMLPQKFKEVHPYLFEKYAENLERVIDKGITSAYGDHYIYKLEDEEDEQRLANVS